MRQIIRVDFIRVMSIIYFMKIRKNINFLYEIGSMRHTKRAWRQNFGMDSATVLEHTARVMWLSLIIARMEGIKNEEKILKMALAHDVAETRTGDHWHLQKQYVSDNEAKALFDIFIDTNLTDFNEGILKEYKERKTKEAKIVKDADNLDCDLELKELEEMGSIINKKVKPKRRIVRNEKLYTKSAKKIWDEIQKSSPSDWHIKANLWLSKNTNGR